MKFDIQEKEFVDIFLQLDIRIDYSNNLMYNEHIDQFEFRKFLQEAISNFLTHLWDVIKNAEYKSTALEQLYKNLVSIESREFVFTKEFEHITLQNIEIIRSGPIKNPLQASDLENLNILHNIQKEYFIRARTMVETLIETVTRLPWSEIWPNEKSKFIQSPREFPFERFYKNSLARGSHRILVEKERFIDYRHWLEGVSSECLQALKLEVLSNIDNIEKLQSYLSIQLSLLDEYLEEGKSKIEKENYDVREIEIFNTFIEKFKKYILNKYVDFLPERTKIKYGIIDPIVPLTWNGSKDDYIDIFAKLIKEKKLLFNGNNGTTPIARKLNEFFTVYKPNSKESYETGTLEREFRESEHLTYKRKK